MSFLSNIFRTSPSSNQWPMIATTIRSGLAEVKTHWFNQCVTAVELGLYEDRTEKARVTQVTLGGAAALAITGYQFCTARQLIAKNSYIAKAARQDFLDMLFGKISETGAGDLFKYIKR